MKNKSAVVWWQKNNTKSVTAKNEGNTAGSLAAEVSQPGARLKAVPVRAGIFLRHRMMIL